MPTARGIAFIALEDEGGVANVILCPEVFAMYRPEIHPVCVGWFTVVGLAV